MTHIPLCTVKGCPHPSDPDFHVPVCGHGLAYEHHHTTKRSRGGALSVQVCICPNCHHKIDNGRWMDGVYDHDDGTIHYFIRDIQGNERCDEVIGQWKAEAAPENVAGNVAESPIEARHTEPVRDVAASVAPAVQEEEAPALARVWDNESDARAFGDDTLPVVQEEASPIVDDSHACRSYDELDFSIYSDQELAGLYIRADVLQRDSFLTKCHVIHAYRERHVQAWGQSWIEQAYDLFEGSPSRRTLEAYANIWQIYDVADAHLQEHLGPLTDSKSLMQFIGRKKPEDGLVALEAAVAHVAEFGEAPTVKALEHKLGVEATPDVCSKGGAHEWIRTCEKCGRIK